MTEYMETIANIKKQIELNNFDATEISNLLKDIEAELKASEISKEYRYEYYRAPETQLMLSNCFKYIEWRMVNNKWRLCHNVEQLNWVRELSIESNVKPIAELPVKDKVEVSFFIKAFLDNFYSEVWENEGFNLFKAKQALEETRKSKLA